MKKGDEVAQTNFNQCTLYDIRPTSVWPNGYSLGKYSVHDTMVASLACPRTEATSTPVTAEGSLGFYNHETVLSGSLPEVPVRLGRNLGNQVVNSLCGNCTYVQSIAE